MIYLNNAQLSESLYASGFTDLARAKDFELDAKEFARHLENVKTRPENERQDAAAFRCLTHGKKAPSLEKAEEKAPQQVNVSVDLTAAVIPVLRWLKIIALLIFLFLVGRISGYAQNVNPAIVVATCGTAPSNYPSAGNRAPNTVDVNGNQCAGVSVSATVATAGLAVSVTVGSTSGTVMTPVGGFVTSAAPTYVNGQSSPLSLDTSGNLRVNASVSVPGSLTVATSKNFPSGTVAITGAESAGTSVASSPAGVGGRDANGIRRDILVSPLGAPIVDFSSTNGVSATQSGTWNINTVTTVTGVTTVASVTSVGPVGNVSAILGALPSGSNTIGNVGLTAGTTVNVNWLTANPGVSAIQSGTWNIGTVSTVTGVTTVASVSSVGPVGNVSAILGALPAGTNAIGKLAANSGVVIGDVNAIQSGTWTVQPGNTANSTPWLVTGSGTAGSAASGVLTVQFADSANPFQDIICPKNTFRAMGAVTLTSSASTSNITWYVNDGTTTTRTAAGSGLKYYIHSYQLVNDGATNARVTFTMDGAAGAPPITLGVGVAPTNTTPFGGSNVTMPSGWFTPTTNRAVSAQISASSTSVYVSVQGCVGP